jgi:hypothetical protein
MLEFRLLKADEIEARVSTCTEKGVSLLLYKDARCDMNILDETVGPLNWQRMHSRDNANCTVQIWDDEKKMWISKEDTGTESNTEAEKGLASDSFKRACTNFGIGRELYTAPFIWFPATDCTVTQRSNGKMECKDKFEVVSIMYQDGCRKIKSVEIGDRTTGKIRTYTTGAQAPEKKKAPTQKQEPRQEQKKDPAPAKKAEPSVRAEALEQCRASGVNPDWIAGKCGCNSFDDLTDETIRRCLKNWKQLMQIFKQEMEAA